MNIRSNMIVTTGSTPNGQDNSYYSGHKSFQHIDPLEISLKFGTDIKIDNLPSAPKGQAQELAKVIFIEKTGTRHEEKTKELNWWIGTITEIGPDFFKAMIEDLSGRISYVEFDIQALPTNNRNEESFLGARFTYSIKSTKTYDGAVEYKTKLFFDQKSKWFSYYNSEIEKIAEDNFPERLLDL
jgi:hypothetical protein